jgi:hypothetical protein
MAGVTHFYGTVYKYRRQFFLCLNTKSSFLHPNIAIFTFNFTHKGYFLFHYTVHK